MTDRSVPGERVPGTPSGTVHEHKCKDRGGYVHYDDTEHECVCECGHVMYVPTPWRQAPPTGVPPTRLETRRPMLAEHPSVQEAWAALMSGVADAVPVKLLRDLSEASYDAGEAAALLGLTGPSPAPTGVPPGFTTEDVRVLRFQASQQRANPAFREVADWMEGLADRVEATLAAARAASPDVVAARGGEGGPTDG